MADLRGALFDMDGLLLDTERVAQEAFVRTVAPLGLPRGAAEEVFTYFVGGNSQSGGPRLKKLLPEADLDEIEVGWVTAFEALIADGVPVKPTVLDTITALAGQGLPMAVVTSSPRSHAEHNLGVAGLLGFFHGIVPGDEVAARKPAPDPYLAGAALLGLAPGDCAAFEDSDTGITAAVTAGCVATQIPDLRPPGQTFPVLGQYHAATLAEAVRERGLLRN